MTQENKKVWNFDPYTEDQFIGTLVRACDYLRKDPVHHTINIDGASGRYLQAQMHWCIVNGYMKRNEMLTEARSEEQWTVYVYNVTPKGLAFAKENQHKRDCK